MIFPTDTIYGIGGNPWDARTTARVRALKQRSEQQPLTLHLSSLSSIEQYALVAPRWTQAIHRLLPGPVTVLLPAHSAAPPATVRNGTVGLRVPDHPFFSDVLRQPVFGTSVNRHGEPPMNDVDRIIDAFPSVDLIVTGPVSGTSSAIVDLRTESYRVLRGTLSPAAQRALEQE